MVQAARAIKEPIRNTQPNFGTIWRPKKWSPPACGHMRVVEEMSEPNVVIPEQFFTRSRQAAPELRLITAVLEDAFHVLLTTPIRRLPFVEACAWINSDERFASGTPSFSFVWICDTLNFDVEFWRARARRIIAERTERDRPTRSKGDDDDAAAERKQRRVGARC